MDFILDKRYTVGEKYMLFNYSPSKVAAIIFVVLFGISSALHVFQMVKNRTWYFIPFVVGGIFEMIGYVGRMVSAGQDYGEWTTGPYIAATLTILLAPALFAASIYMILGRIINLVEGQALSPIRVKWLTAVFVVGDVISFFAQAGGGGMLSQAKKQKDVDLGENIITGGLAVQVLFFVLFIIVAFIFNRRIINSPTIRSQELTVPWQRYLYILYIASALILIRSVFRIAEYAMGSDGVLLKNEYFLYIFDATMMFLVMLVFNIYHPSRIISHRRKVDNGSRGTEDSSYDLQEHHDAPRKH